MIILCKHQALRLAGGAYPGFFRLAAQIDVLIETVDPTNEAAVDGTVAEIRQIFDTIDWLPLPFQAILDGKTYLPKNKIRPDLFGKQGFLRSGDYRRHFFGTASMRDVVQAFIREKVAYTTLALNTRRLFAK